MNIRLLLALCTLVACGTPPGPVVATSPPPTSTALAVAPKDAEPTTPLDPQIRTGTLPNGLTYYVVQHHKPLNRAALWLAVNAGSVLEDDDQRGLAHFVEHMAFNGTKRFPKQALIDYIEKAGMRFGPDVNAYTSFDETVYQLTVPTDDRAVMMTGLDILRDWASDVSLDPAEIEKERGVVLEEWRRGRGAWARINDKEWPVMFQGSRYAERLPIGLPEIIRGAPPATLLRFYKDWYRPENMAAIAVGDFDPDVMQKEIAERFGAMSPSGKGRTREAIPVPHDHPTAVTIATDPEMPYSQVTVYDKLDHRPEVTRSDFRRSLVERLYHRMMGARFDELALDPTAPFVDAYSYTGDLTRSVDGFVRGATAKQGKTAEALSMLFREIARVERHGFLQGELDRARAAKLARAETAAAEWDKAHNDEIADEITRHYFTREYMPGRPYELQLTRELLPTITLAELNHLARSWGSDKGRVITVSGPASVTLPVEAAVRELAALATAAPIDPWKDTPPPPLLASSPKPGRAVSTKRDDATGSTVWTLANGIRVIVKPTTFQNDSVDISGWQKGGSSLASDVIHARFADEIVGRGGAGELDAIALRKALAGKVVNIQVYLSEMSEDVWGSARPVDLETALQLLYVKLTAPRRDERAFAAWRAEQTEYVRNHRLDPEESFYEDMMAIRDGNHPRRQPTTPEMIAKTDLDKAFALWRERFGDLGNFTFTFVGNVDPAKLLPLVETYLGSLPSKGRKETWKDIGIKYPSGKINKTVVAGTEPKSYVSMTLAANDTWTRDAERDAEVLSMVLRIRLREVLREDMGGVYSTRVSVWISREPTQRREVTISFGCDPASVDKLREAVYSVTRAIQKDGIGAGYLAKVTEQLRRSRETDSKENWWWAGQLYLMDWYGEDFGTVTDLEPTLARVTSDRVKATAKRFLDERNMVIGVLHPTAPTAAAKATERAGTR